MNFGRPLMCAAALVAALALSACAETGDFGRLQTQPSYDGEPNHAFSDLKIPAVSFNLTDQEAEMRDRVWRYLIAPEAYDWFGDAIASLTRTGFQPVRLKAPPKDRYYQWIRGTAFASSRVRYSKLADDIAADITMMPTTFAAICAVEGVDRQRGIAADGVSGLENKMLQQAVARHAENRAVIGWFVAAVGARYDAYSYALDHLLVETPHEGAIGVDARLSDLEVFVEAARRDDFCAPSEDVVPPSGQPTIASRYLRPTPPPTAGS